MKSPYTKTYFARNRKKLRSQVEISIPIIISANTQLQYSADSAYPFRQDTNFWYITGLDDPDLTYIHDGEKECIILPKQNTVRDVFDGAIATKELVETSGIERVLTHNQGMVLFKNLVKKHNHIATLLPATGLQVRYGIAPNPARKMLVNRLRRLRAGLTFQHLGLVFAHMRMVKSPEEISAIQASIDCKIAAFNQVKHSLQPGVYEYELEAIMTGHFRSQNAIHAYPPIVAGGKNACVLHYGKNQSKLSSQKAVLIDVGAEVWRGAADITRTYSVGRPSKTLLRVHQAVARLQDFAFSQLKPGISMRDFERVMEQETGKELKELGIIKQASRKQIRKYCPHATSHFLGLDVHDAADYDRVLEPNMVLTVEPGIYLPEEGVGVRIEDDVLITDNGVEVLSGSLPRDL